MSVAPSGIGDFVIATLQRFVKKNRWVDISRAYQHYWWAKLYYDQNKGDQESGIDPEDSVDGGEKLQWPVQVRNTSTARNTQLFDEDQTDVKDLLVEAEVPWAMQTCNFSYDEREKVFQGDDATKVIDYLEVRKHAMFNEWFEFMEQQFWSSPAYGTTPQAMFGVPFWIQKPSSNGGFGFNGLDPSGYSAGAAGILSSTYARWANGTATWTSISEDDYCASLTEACDKSKFQSPHSYDELVKSKKMWPYSLFTVYTVYKQLGLLLKRRNDNLGTDLDKYMGTMVFRGIPFHWVPCLEDAAATSYDSRKPTYGIHWGSFKYFFQKGEKMKLGKPQDAPGQHRVKVVHMDNAGNTRCLSRRDNFGIFEAA